ncbi:MAG TPA: putative Ig domain-containing protein [Candidatus Dormibacteraeota bacterium]|nr:putative Ig domain-containing protein [Candidatus Dormibacteraeota bacterium]
MAAAVLVVSGCELKPPANQQASSPSPVASPSPSPEPTPVAITAPAFHSGEVTVAYAPVALAATGGTPPFQWTLGGGALPGGLALSADGSVSGTPTADGNFNFTAHVTDTGGRTADVSASISIVPAPVASLRSDCAQYCSVEVGCDITCGSFGFLTGGTAPFSFAVLGGYVPKGVSLQGFALAGTFTTPAKFWQFTVQVTDALGATATISPTFYVYDHISLSGGVCTGNYGTGCTVSLPYSGGTPGGTPSVAIAGNAASDAIGCWAAAGGPVPTGSTVTASGGQVTVTIPKQLINGYGAVWTLVLTDQSLCGAGTYCTSSGAAVSIRVQCG